MNSRSISPEIFSSTVAQRHVFSPSMIVKAIYGGGACQHFYQGFRQFLRLPEFLSMGHETRELMQRSLKSNVVNYLLPVLFYRRLVGIASDCVPSEYEVAINAMDTLITGMLVTRLFLRRFLDNTVYSACLPKVIANDKAAHLPTLLAVDLAEFLADSFKKIFQSEVGDIRTSYSDLAVLFDKHFNDLFLRENIAVTSRSGLAAQIELILLEVIDKQDFLSASPHFVKEFSRALSRMIATELVYEAFEKFQKVESVKEYRTLSDNQKKLPLVQALKIHPQDSLATGYADSLFTFVRNLRKKIQLLLPISHEPPCSCEKKKIQHAEFSSPIYYGFNLALVDFRSILSKVDISVLENNMYVNGLTFLVRLLIYGQSLNEYRVAEEGQCTRHRYMHFARNKMYCIGTGLAFLFWKSVLELTIFLALGVRSFFISDAISNVVMQLSIIATLSYNEPLPGKEQNPVDWFVFPRALARQFSNFIRTAYIKSVLNCERHPDRLRQIKNMSHSRVLSGVAQYVLTGSDLLPEKVMTRLERFWCSGKFSEVEVGDFQLIEPPSGFDYVVALLLKNQSVNFALDVYRDGLQSTLDRVQLYRMMSAWIAKLYLILPTPGFMPSLLALAIRILRDDELMMVVDRLNLHLQQMREARAATPVILPHPNRVDVEPVEQAQTEKSMRAIVIPAFFDTSPAAHRLSEEKTSSRAPSPLRVEEPAVERQVASLQSVQENASRLARYRSAKQYSSYLSKLTIIKGGDVIKKSQEAVKMLTSSVNKQDQEMDALELVSFR